MPKVRHAEETGQGSAVEGNACAAEILAAAVTELEQLDAASLRRRWRTLVGGVVPPNLGRPLTLRILAYKLQAQRLGDLDKASLRELSVLLGRSRKGGDGQGSPAELPPCLPDEDRKRFTALEATHPRSAIYRIARPGTLLTREYGGALHRVMVLNEGVSWNGMTYESLSKVAAAITGTKWNGPRFFGLRDRAEDEKDNRQSSAAEKAPVIGRGRAVRLARRASS